MAARRVQGKQGLLNALQRLSLTPLLPWLPASWLQGYFASRTIIEPLGPGRCRHVLEQEIR